METTAIKGISATDVLRKDYQSIKDLFRQFDEATSDRQKKSIGDECLRKIEIHTMLEEELFYPTVRRHVGERQRVVQALAALQVAKLIIKELKGLSGGEHYNARFNLLKEDITQLIDQEEAEILPRVEKSDVDLQQLAKQMFALKSRVSPTRFLKLNGRTAAIGAGVAVLGVTAWMVNRFRNNRR